MNNSHQTLDQPGGDEELKQQVEGDGALDDELDYAEGAKSKAEGVIYDVYMRGENKITLMGLQIQDLTFLAHSTNTGDGGGIEQPEPKKPDELAVKNVKQQLTLMMLSSMWEQVQEIDVSRNLISQIDALNQFRNLRILRASENYIVDVSLTQPRLEALYLEDNQIRRFPQLSNLHKIRVVNLSNNRLEEFKAEFKAPSCNSLVELDISHNAIDYATDSEFFEQFLDRIKKAKNLKVLWLQGNPFIAKDRRLEKVVAQLQVLELLNGEPASNFKRAVAQAEETKQQSTVAPPKPLPQMPGKGVSGGKKSKMDKNAVYIPTLEILCYSLEAANSHPSYALEHLRDLAHDVEKVGDHLDLVDEHFAKGKNEDEINEMIEDFMQNAQLLINNHHELQHIMLKILSKLSIIKFYRFGVSCFNTLKDLMIAGKEMEEMVTEIIKQEVIHMLHQQANPEMVPDSLLSGLHELVKKTEQSDMVTGLFENCFPQWLRQLIVRLNSSRKIAVIYDDNPHFDSVLGLLSVSLLSGEGSGAGLRNAEKAVEKGLVGLVADILNESTWEKERYLHCLKIVERLSEHAPAAANQFFDKSTHTYLMKNIRDAMLVYKKNNDLCEADAGKDDEKSLPRKYITLAAEIDSLGALLNSDDPHRRYEVLSKPLVDDMLSILRHYRTDPVLLTALCRFAKAYFSCEEVKQMPDLIVKVEKTQSLTQLVPYLGLKKYEELLKMARRYQQGGEGAGESDKFIQFQHLDDPVVHGLFIAIVQLMSFFCEEAANDSDNDGSVFELVSKALNESSRETALFNCIEVPNDDLKLAVVECLYNVSLAEFDSEELTQIVKVLSSCKNIGAGKTELVLAKLFWILTKLTKDEEEDSGKTFRLKFGEKAVKEACEILARNMSRQIDEAEEDEEHEKLSLSLSCLHFLKFVSVNPDTKKYLLNKHEQLKQILFADQNCTSESFAKFAVDVERTYLGRNMDTLLYVLNGEDSISPYNYVSFRVIQRMADVLMNLGVDEEVFDPFEPGADVLHEMKTHYRAAFKARKQREREYWREPDRELIERIKLAQYKNTSVATNDSAFYNNLYKQHYWFTSNNGIPILRMFLTKKVPLCEQWLKQEYDKGYDKHNLTLYQAMVKQVKKQEKKEMWHRLQQEIKKEKPIEVPKKEEVTLEQQQIGLKTLKRALMMEELGQHYDAEKAVDHLTLQSMHSKPQVLEQGIVKRNIFAENKQKNNASMIQSLKLRSLCIAAYLRCLYGALEYAPKEQLRAEAMQSLRELYVFRNITILCDTTGWLEANIGAKYLRIARHVIKASFMEVKEDKEERIQHYELVARAIRKMLTQIRIKLQNEQQKPLTNEDKVLIFEIAYMCSLMCSQIVTMFEWSTLEVSEQGTHMRTRRTPQEKSVDKMLALMFPSQHIKTLIDIVFRDMELSYRQLDRMQAQLLPAENADVSEKAHLAREHIKMFLGDYLSRCKDSKYDILESMMKGVVFEKKRLRESFQQEILDAQIFSSYKVAIQGYLYNPTLNRLGLGPNERVVHMSWVLCAQHIPGKKYQDYQPRLLILTNVGVHLMLTPPGKPCTYCPPENLCPNGPTPEFKFPYENRLVKFLLFPDLPQKLVLCFTPDKPVPQQPLYNNLEMYHIISVLIPKDTSAREFIRVIKEEISIAYDGGSGKQIEEMNDKLFKASMQRIVCQDEPQEQSAGWIFAKYASVNPPAKGGGILSMIGMGGSSTSQSMNYDILSSCALVVLTGKELIFLKESWQRWVFDPSQERVDNMVSLLSNKDSGNERGGLPASQQEILLQNKLKQAISTVLQQDARRQLSDIVNLHIHKGREPLVEIEYSGKKKDMIVFQCDLARQEFVKALVDIKNAEDE